MFIFINHKKICVKMTEKTEWDLVLKTTTEKTAFSTSVLWLLYLLRIIILLDTKFKFHIKSSVTVMISIQYSHNIDKRGQQAATESLARPSLSEKRVRLGQRESGPGFAHWRGPACRLACFLGCLSVWVTVRLVYFSSSSPSSIFYMGLGQQRWQKWIAYVV